MFNKIFKIGCLTALIIFLAAMPAWALMLGFGSIVTEDSNAEDLAIGVAQLSVDVDRLDADTVQFTFRNDGSEAMFIGGVYFDDAANLLNAASVSFGDSVGDVEFEATKKVKDLPGGNEAEFEAYYSYAANKPGSGAQGVDPGETLIMTFDLSGAYGDLLAALRNGTFKIGIHAQGFDEDEGDGSESFIASVPEPSTLLLFGTGLVGLAGLKRKKLLKK